MDVVGHEAVAHQRTGIEPGVLAEEGNVDEAVGIAMEDVAASVAALGDVMGYTLSDDSRETGPCVN